VTVAIRSVVFDIGETLIDDTGEWGRWADWLGVPRHTFSAVMGAVVGSGRSVVETFHYFRPDFDLDAERQLREAAGVGECLTEEDLYSDVRPALQQLREAGYWVGVVGNQTALAGRQLRTLGLPVDDIATSGEWGVVKPSAAFFARLAGWALGGPDEIVYVGDHPPHDVVPAVTAGLRPILIRRGPWGHLWAEDAAGGGQAALVVDSLAELPDIVAQMTPTR
jgi:FMN phosphatase YigB (HAD superfamily)